MSEAFDPQKQRAFYWQHLQESLLPFWLQRSIDAERGGYYTCFDNTGARLLSTDKFTWSQGRMVWALARLAAMDDLSPAEQERFLSLARSGAEFLMAHCLLPNGNCTFLMDREGRPKPQSPGADLDSSVYADCFVVLGLARYARTSGERAALDFARRLYASITQRIETNTYKSAPYPTPDGAKPHGIPMIMLNVSHELSGALAALGHGESAAVNARAEGYLQEIVGHFLAPDGTVREYIGVDNRLLDNLLGRYINPGHTLECMWFILEQVGGQKRPEVVSKVLQATRRACQLGWDGEFGGVLHFVDHEGGVPHGSTVGLENEKMVEKVRNDWGNKLWWTHSEALYTTLLAYSLTREAEFMSWHQKVHDYAFRTFPNPDPTIGEWIQIRDRQGRPEQKVVALPVKDPFHILRNVILILDLLARMEK